MSLFESFWASWKLRKRGFPSLQLWWDRGKDHIKRLATAFCSKKKTAEGQARALLSGLASHLKAKIDCGSVLLVDTYESVLSRLADFDHLEAEGARVRARVRWAEEGEMSSHYFLRVEKKHGAEQ